MSNKLIVDASLVDYARMLDTREADIEEGMRQTRGLEKARLICENVKVNALVTDVRLATNRHVYDTFVRLASTFDRLNLVEPVYKDFDTVFNQNLDGLTTLAELVTCGLSVVERMEAKVLV